MFITNPSHHDSTKEIVNIIYDVIALSAGVTDLFLTKNVHACDVNIRNH
ncbi:hypothetical protein A359_00120 [secondary endosymbiont of Ctenarytaina eucalypti]|uniref:Uncharacterized protein n=1 Tax=secondary endosymbiont of Ctenarytaina eucalypti TaxID=1199245 RepID=J3VR60_9ENTR|nr:hypothetical protein A359_00120 [secondary endosymbiont of Ctenarytaina eucalypti]